MKGDFTRDTFRQEKHYSRVLKQQGRVSLDADWNEAIEILTYRGRTARHDIIGPCCGPENNAGFEITAVGDDLGIGPGRYYVRGILCENETGHLYTAQEDFPNAELPPLQEVGPDDEPPDPNGLYLAYLDVWERHITALEDPDIRDVALGGPDTATRAQVIAQVKLVPVDDDVVCSDFSPGWQPADVTSTGQLAARSQPSDEAPDPCIAPPGAGYRRLENQLYRVEIHAPGAIDTATFKWSRENGTVVTEWIAQDGDVLTVSSSGRDENLGFATGNWIELTDDTRELQGRPGVLVQLADVQGRELTLDSATIADPDNPGATSVNIGDFLSTRKIRRWESAGALTVEIPGDNDGYLSLEGGVEVRFGPAGGEFQTGDYWLIPARTNIGDVLWPTDEGTHLPIPETRHGIEHFYCALALLQLDDDGWTRVHDCRCLFTPLSDLPTDQGAGCCSVTVGDGTLSTGDFDNIQAAVDAIADAGKVCILPGTYQLRQPVVIEGRDIAISGCGRQTHIIAASPQPAFIARNGQVHFESLSISAASEAGAIVLQRSRFSGVHDCLIRNRSQRTADIDSFTARAPAHHHILGRRFGLSANIDTPDDGTGPAIAVADSRLLAITDNALLGRPAVQLQAVEAEVRHNLAVGTIWIRDGSANIEIVDNTVQGGVGAGILLGGANRGNELLNNEAGVRFAIIRDNRILNMTDNGIGSMTEQGGITGLGDLEDITISGNSIHACARQPTRTLDGDGVGGIVLSNASRLRIVNNEILDNGPAGQPACGILTQDCEGLEVIDNHVAENGSSDLDAERCIDFRSRDDDQDDTPLVIDGTAFRNINVGEDGMLYRIDSNASGAGAGSGLQCHNGLLITLPETVDSVSLLLLGQPAVVEAVDASGNVIQTVQDDGSQPLTVPRTLTVGVSGIRVLRIQPTIRLWLLQICTGTPAVGYQAGIAALFVYGGEYTPPQGNALLPTHVPGRAALVAHGNTVVCPAGQALWALGTGRMLVNDNVFTSRGEYPQPVPDEIDDGDGSDDFWLNLAQVGRCVSIVNLGIALELVNVLTGQVTTARPTYLASTTLAANPRTALQVPPGFVQCHDNQIIFNVIAAEERFVLPAVFVASFDDASIQSNQVRSDIIQALQIADIFIFGATVQVQTNRLTERPNTAYASCLSAGLVNNTVSNIATHCILAVGSAVIEDANQVINGAACPDRQTELAGTNIIGANL